MYKLDLSLITSAENLQPTKTAETFLLKQNYPNPFNPTTTIPFTISKQGRVRLAIYNSLGQEIRVLLDEIKAGGHYQIEWDGRDNQGKTVAAGVYVYRLETEGFNQSRQLTFLK